MANNFISIGHFPSVAFFSNEDGELETTRGSSCDLEGPPIWSNLDEGVGPTNSPTGNGTPFPFSLTLEEAMAMFWKVKSWGVEFSFPFWTIDEETCTYRDGGSINETWRKQHFYYDKKPFINGVSTGAILSLENLRRPSDLVCSDFLGQGQNGFSDLYRNFSTIVGGSSGCEDPVSGYQPEPTETEVSISINSYNAFGQGDATGVDGRLTKFQERYYFPLSINAAGYRSNVSTLDSFSQSIVPPIDEISSYATFIVAGSEREIQIPMYNLSGDDDYPAPTVRIYPAEYFTF